MQCIAGMLLIANMAFNPAQITSFQFVGEQQVVINTTHRYGMHRFTVENLRLEEQRAILLLWKECKNEPK